MGYLDLADRSWPLLNRVVGVHTAVYRLTGGRVGHHVPGLAPMLLLDHVGARSGAHRTLPLVYVRDGDDIVLVASKVGHPKHPAWFHNLKANPATTVQIGGRRLPVQARVATAAEHKRLWPTVVKAYAGFDEYQRRAERKIPLVLLSPRPA